MRASFLVVLFVLVGCGDASDATEEHSENENHQNDTVETWGVTQQCEYLGGLYGCDGDFAAWDVFMASCEASIPESCSAEDQSLLSHLFSCLQAADNHQTCSDADYATCESAHSLSQLSDACDEVIAL